MGTSAPPLPYTRLLSFLKYGTSLDRWYNWYIVYTTILDYNNHILFRVCQVYKMRVSRGFQIRQSIVVHARKVNRINADYIT